MLAKIDRWMETLTVEQQRSVAFHVHRTWGGAMSSTERSRLRRSLRCNEIGNENVASESNETCNENVAGRRNEIVAPQGNETVASPPAPPAVSSFFGQFWSLYPKRVGKGAAERAWKKQDCEKKGQSILEALSSQLAFINREGGKFRPNPATWLNEKRWEDEPPQPSFLSEKTSGNAAAARAFVERKTGHDEPR